MSSEPLTTGEERPTAYRLSSMLEEMRLAGVTDPFDARDRAALAALGYVAARAGEALDVERLATAMDACLPEAFNEGTPGNRVRAKAIAREYVALHPDTAALKGSEQ